MEKKRSDHGLGGIGARFAAMGMAIAAWALVFAFLGCAHLFPKVSEQDLRERVAVVWQAKVDGDCDVIYENASALYRRQVTLEDNRSKCRSRIEKFEIAGITFSEDKTRAKVSVRFDIKQMGFLIPGAILQENWLQEDGRWVADLAPPKSGSPF
ncbi:MAG: hypothetical protein ACOZF0_01765 [Thermodesulfobacteriota bacterium]